MVAIVFYHIAVDEKGDMNSTIILIMAVAAVLPLFIMSPEYIIIGIKEGRFFVNRRHVLYPKKSERLNIAINDLKATRIERKDSIFKSRLIIEYVIDEFDHQMSIPLINFKSNQKQTLIKHIYSL